MDVTKRTQVGNVAKTILNTNTVTLEIETTNKFKNQNSLRSEPTADFSKNTDVGTDARARVERAVRHCCTPKSRIAPNACTLKIKILTEFENNVAKISANQVA